jgi:hypothetical protein
MVARQKIVLANKLLGRNVHLSRRNSRATVGNRILDRVPEFKRKALDTWQRTEILLHALHHWK